VAAPTVTVGWLLLIRSGERRKLPSRGDNRQNLTFWLKWKRRGLVAMKERGGPAIPDPPVVELPQTSTS